MSFALILWLQFNTTHHNYSQTAHDYETIMREAVSNNREDYDSGDTEFEFYDIPVVMEEGNNHVT